MSFYKISSVSSVFQTDLFLNDFIIPCCKIFTLSRIYVFFLIKQSSLLPILEEKHTYLKTLCKNDRKIIWPFCKI